MKKIFKTVLDINLFDDGFYSSVIVPVSPFLLVNVEYSVGLSLTTENIFKPKKNILSETTVLNGKFDSHYIRYYFQNNNSFFKLVELYNKRVLNMILEFKNETKDFTLTISSNSENNIVVLSIKNYNEKIKLIYFEIQIKIIINNLIIKN